MDYIIVIYKYILGAHHQFHTLKHADANVRISTQAIIYTHIHTYAVARIPVSTPTDVGLYIRANT